MPRDYTTYHVETHGIVHSTHNTPEAAIAAAELVQSSLDADPPGNGDMAQVRRLVKSGSYKSEQIIWPKTGQLMGHHHAN